MEKAKEKGKWRQMDGWCDPTLGLEEVWLRMPIKLQEPKGVDISLVNAWKCQWGGRSWGLGVGMELVNGLKEEPAHGGSGEMTERMEAVAHTGPSASLLKPSYS